MSLVNCTFIEHVQWLTNQNTITLSNNQTHVWRVQHFNKAKKISFCKKFLSENELSKANRFFKAEHQNNYISSHAALRIILSKYIDENPQSIQFTINKNKKPQLAAEHTLIQFNLSHSQNYSLIAVSFKDIGADVEYINKQFSYYDILKTFFNDDEIDFIRSSSNSIESFFTCWTRKEALLKATSLGLTENILNIPCLNGEHIIDRLITEEDWLIKTFTVTDDYIGSIALQPTCSKINFFDFKL